MSFRNDDGLQIPEPPDEREAVKEWRIHRLLSAGYMADDAWTLGFRMDIDIGDAVKLIESGCPSPVAAAILT